MDHFKHATWDQLNHILKILDYFTSEPNASPNLKFLEDWVNGKHHVPTYSTQETIDYWEEKIQEEEHIIL